MSLDYARGEYLSAVTANFGLYRPVFGFSDSVWRAVAKSLGLDYKQVATKFMEILTILFGPRESLVSCLAENVVAGARTIRLTETSHLPQLGKAILDEGTPQEEEISFVFLDRTTNTLFLESPLLLDHTATADEVASLPVVIASGDRIVTPLSTGSFTQSPLLYPVLNSADSESRIVTAFGPRSLSLFTTTTEVSPRYTAVSTTISSQPPNGSFLIPVDDATQFPDSGMVRVGPGTNFTTSLAGSTSSVVNLSALPFNSFSNAPDRLSGFVIRFVGNITASLAGQERVILRDYFAAFNNRTVELDSPLPASPALNDQVYIAPILFYRSVDREESALVVQEPTIGGQFWFPVSSAFSTGAPVVLLEDAPTISFSQFRMPGIDWDVIQSTPGLVELLVPDLLQRYDLRSASYLHPEQHSPAATVTTGGASSGDTVLTVADTSGFPIVATVIVDAGSPEEELMGYYVSSPTELSFPKSLGFSHSVGTTVSLYEPVYGGTDVISGDYRYVSGTYPGSYVFSPTEPAPTAFLSKTSLTEMLPGPSTLVLSQPSGKSAIEVRDAKSWERLSFPYQILLGDRTGSREEVTVNNLAFKERTRTIVVDTAVAPGDTEIEVASLSMGGPGDAADFLDVDGYRVILGRGTPDAEVVYVQGTEVGPNRLVLDAPTIGAHPPGTSVELLADVCAINPLSFSHAGVFAHTTRSSSSDLLAPFPAYDSRREGTAHRASPLVSEVSLLSTTGFNSTGSVLLNFGRNKTLWQSGLSAPVASGATSFIVADGSGFPSGGGGGEFVLTIDKGLPTEERVVAINRIGNNVAIDFGLRYAHAVGSLVGWDQGEPEQLFYSSVSGNTLVLTAPTVLQSSHAASELAVESVASSDPKRNGFDFPLRLPPDPITRLRYLIDLIRAAGIQVEIISQR